MQYNEETVTVWEPEDIQQIGDDYSRGVPLDRGVACDTCGRRWLPVWGVYNSLTDELDRACDSCLDER